MRGMRVWSASLLLLVLCLGAPIAQADEDATAELAKRVKALVADLRSDDYATRRQARLSLKGLGADAHEHLSPYATDDDAEVRRTIQELLGPDWKPEEPPVEQSALDQLGQVAITSTGSLRGALKAAGDPVGARFTVPDGHPDEVQLPRSLSGSVFDVVAQILDAATLHQARPFDNMGRAKLAPRGSDLPPAPRAASGPLEVRVREITATRSLTATARPKYSLGIELRWAPCVQVMQFSSPRLAEAKDTGGVAFTGTAGRAVTTYGVSYVETSRRVAVGLMPTADEYAERLDHLVIELPVVRLRVDPTQVTFNDLTTLPQVLDGTGASVASGTKGSIELRAMTKEGTDRRPQYVMELVGMLPNKTARASAQVYVTWTDGKQERVHVMGGRSLAADGTLNLTVRAWPRGERSPKSVHVRWFENETQGSLRFRLADIPLR